jgi:hypothetical protein
MQEAPAETETREQKFTNPRGSNDAGTNVASLGISTGAVLRENSRHSFRASDRPTNLKPMAGTKRLGSSVFGQSAAVSCLSFSCCALPNGWGGQVVSVTTALFKNPRSTFRSPLFTVGRCNWLQLRLLRPRSAGHSVRPRPMRFAICSANFVLSGYT